MRRVLLLTACLLGACLPASAQDTTLTPRLLEAALAAQPQGADAERLADRVREAFGGREVLLAGGGAPKIDGLQVAWAIEMAAPVAPDAPAPTVDSDAVHFTRRLTRIGTTPVYAAVVSLSHGDAFSWHFTSGTRRFGGGQLEVYENHADSLEKAGVPRGVVTQQAPWTSTIFAGTTRDWWVYVPAQYTPASRPP